MKDYLVLTKTGIILFALLSSVAGYFIGLSAGEPVQMLHPVLLLIGLYLVSGGSFALNQAQEWRRDALMARTEKRPIPAGRMAPWQAYALAFLFITFGSFVLWLLNATTAVLALATVLMYNGVYTLYCKRKWAFAAIPGAIPGAMPVVIGYSAASPNVFTMECLYLFLIMFLWQMPHFWCLAIRYREDYARGGFPVLPLQLGVSKTLYHIGLYLFAYVGLAIATPWFLHAHVLYLFLIFPLCIKLLWEFMRYFQSGGEQRWLQFFLWTNLSMLVFLAAPVFDKWLTFMVI